MMDRYIVLYLKCHASLVPLLYKSLHEHGLIPFIATYLGSILQPRLIDYKYSLLMHCIKIKSPAKSLLNEEYIFVGGNIYFLCVLSCSSEEA